jgi:hypothetical protein
MSGLQPALEHHRADPLIIGTIVNWTEVDRTVHGLATLATSEGTHPIEQFIITSTSPLRGLATVAALAQRSMDGDVHAEHELRAALTTIVEVAPWACGLFGRFVAGKAQSPDAAHRACSCDPGPEMFPPARSVSVPKQDEVIDEAGLVGLVLAVARTYASDPRRDRLGALDSIMALVSAAQPFVTLARAHRAGGDDALVAQLEVMSSAGLLRGMGGLPLRGGFGGPGVPDFPDFPDGWPGKGGAPATPRRKPLDELLAAVKGRKRWDPEQLDQVFPLQREPIAFVSPGWEKHLACMREAARRISVRVAIEPPARPTRVTFTDGITSIVVSGACAGDALVIHGNGFAALRPTALLLLPFADGCHPVDVPSAGWTDTAITIPLPTGVVSGPIGFGDAAYIAAYNAWAAEQNRLGDEIRQLPCHRLAGKVAFAAPFSECPADIGINRLRAGAPIISAFTANGQPLTVVEPGTAVRLAWTVRNAEQIRITRVSGGGPGFGGSAVVNDPPGTAYDLGPFTGDQPLNAEYELRVTGPCGFVTARVEARLRKLPVLRIVGVEVTQAIQSFREPGTPDNSVKLVASKDTIVRVYVSVENLAGFKPNGYAPDEVRVSGEAHLNGAPLGPPLAEAKARPNALIQRATSDNTLQFRIPASLASGSGSLRVKVWAVDEVETPPVGLKIRPAAWPVYHPITWVAKAAFKVRYVRISHASSAAPSDLEARNLVLRGFQLLATPPTDIAPARMATWHTSVDIDTKEGISDLLDHLDDQHDCTVSEEIFPWEDECPDRDYAVWVGVLGRILGGPGGMAQAYHPFNSSRNTVIVSPVREMVAHELGHALRLNHVNVGCNGYMPEGDFDTLPDGGKIRSGDACDPATGNVVAGSPDLFDVMTYACSTWVSRATWQRVFDKF